MNKLVFVGLMVACLMVSVMGQMPTTGSSSLFSRRSGGGLFDSSLMPLLAFGSGKNNIRLRILPSENVKII